MPKLTMTGWEIGSSEAGAIVLHKTAFTTRSEVLTRHKHARAGVEHIDRPLNLNAIRRGTHLEHGVAAWAQEVLEEKTDAEVYMYEPDSPYQKPEYGIASSIDRIIEVNNLQMDMPDGSECTFSGMGVMEIKTDFYHTGRPKPEWVIQVQHQLICADLEWGLICCMDQAGKLNFYPVKYEPSIVKTMLEAYEEFWSLVNEDGEYPPIANEVKVKYQDIEKLLPKTNQDVMQLCSDFLKASAEEREWRKAKSELKEALAETLDALGVTHARLPGFEIVSFEEMKQKKQMVDTGELVPSHKFSIKEIASE
ncbi:MAG: YqaJ viral recombinase family protein [Alphaproteobacteria bacterium]